MRAAKAWGLTPREWRSESTDDQALMLAFTLFEGTVESYRQEWRERKKDQAKNGGGGNNTFSAMKRRLRGGNNK